MSTLAFLLFLPAIPLAPGYCTMSTLAFLLLLPAIPLVLLSYLLDMLFCYFFGFLWMVFTCQFCNFCASREALAPYRGGPWVVNHLVDVFVYRGGPWVVTHLGDVFVCVIGLGNRQGPRGGHGMLEVTWLLTNMIYAVPTLKYCPYHSVEYWIECNPLVYRLRERFATQLSTSMLRNPALHLHVPSKPS
ncbi:hypothetical protein T484DRAFT_1850103 [Baffinella frigidus]|nr:hypothetical protein T484DRAFT_1850103 [Cryptophyta sp. CCMP2293]